MPQHPFISLIDEYVTFLLQSDLNIQEEDSDIIADHGDISIGGNSLGTNASTPSIISPIDKEHLEVNIEILHTKKQQLYNI